MLNRLRRRWQVRSWPDRLRRALFPPVCLICGQDGRAGIDCCAGCEPELPLLAAQCARCGIEMDSPVELCGRCAMALPAFHNTWPGFAYSGPIERLIQRFKFHGDLAAGRLLADLLARRLIELEAPRPQLIVPVPLHARRQLRRGFNQSALISRDLSRWFGHLPWLEALRRSRPTVAQSELPAERRSGNVRGAFQLHRLPPGCRHVALVDDVMTTGSTLNECARVLLQAGVRRVDVWVVARA